MAWSLQRRPLRCFNMDCVRERKERDRRGKNASPCPPCTSGLSLFQVIHHPRQRSTPELLECGMIIMKGLNVSLCTGGGTSVLTGERRTHTDCKWTYLIPVNTHWMGWQYMPRSINGYSFVQLYLGTAKCKQHADILTVTVLTWWWYNVSPFYFSVLAWENLLNGTKHRYWLHVNQVCHHLYPLLLSCVLRIV